MNLFQLLAWSVIVLAAAALGGLVGGGPAAAAAAWIPGIVMGVILVRSRREAPDVGADAVRYRLSRREAWVETWSFPTVRGIAALLVIFGLPGTIALVKEGVEGNLDLRWPHVVGMAVAAPFLLVMGLVVVSAVRRLHSRERALAWSNTEITAWAAGERTTLRRDELRPQAWRGLILLRDNSGGVIAAPCDLAHRAGVTGQAHGVDD